MPIGRIFPSPFRDVNAQHRLRMITTAMNLVFQVEQALVETLAIFVPRDLIHP
jgi:hypothetical protein